MNSRSLLSRFEIPVFEIIDSYQYKVVNEVINGKLAIFLIYNCTRHLIVVWKVGVFASRSQNSCQEHFHGQVREDWWKHYLRQVQLHRPPRFPRHCQVQYQQGRQQLRREEIADRQLQVSLRKRSSEVDSLLNFKYIFTDKPGRGFWGKFLIKNLQGAGMSF